MKKIIFLIFLMNLWIIFWSCTPPKGDQVPSSSKDVSYSVESEKSYEVEGEGDEYFEARRNAIIKGIGKAIIDIIGREKFEANIDVIKRELYENRSTIGKVAEFSSTDIFDRAGNKVVRGIVRVKIDVLKSYLDKIQFSDKPTQFPSSSIQKDGDTILKKTKISTDMDESSSSEVFEIKEDSPLNNVSFLVFIPSDKVSLLEDQEDYKMLIEAINAKLSDYGLDYVDLKRVIELSKKFQYIYEEKSGEVMSLVQMLAQEVRAGVYIEADIDVKYNFVSGNTVDIVIVGSMKAYDASTGKGLGVVSFSKNKKSSRGMFVAKTEGISEIVDSEFPKLLKNIEDYFKKGVKIEVSVIGFQNISEEKDFSNILDSLPGKVSKTRKSISSNMSEYEIMYKGGSSQFVDDLIEAISNDPKFSKASIDQTVNKVIVKLK